MFTNGHLSEHPDALTLTIDGVERPWLPGRKALRLAKARGHDVDAFLTRLAGATEAGRHEQLEIAVEFLWIGLLPFDETLPDCEAFGDGLSMGQMGALIPVLFGSQEVDTGESGNEGKGRRGRRASVSRST